MDLRLWRLQPPPRRILNCSAVSFLIIMILPPRRHLRSNESYTMTALQTRREDFLDDLRAECFRDDRLSDLWLLRLQPPPRRILNCSAVSFLIIIFASPGPLRLR